MAMYKKIFVLVPMLVIAGTAVAQTTDTATGDVTVGGNVARLCVLGQPSPPSIDVGQMAETSGTRVGRIRTIGTQSVILPGSFCNFAGSAVSVAATALVVNDTLSVQPGFARAVNFTASASNWAATPTATTTATAGGGTPTATGTGASQPLPKIADVRLDLTSFTAPSDALLVAGTYSGLVVVTLGPDSTSGGGR
jgi:hypothetical protein